MKNHEENVEGDKGEDGDPDGQAKVADHKMVSLADQRNVLGVLDKERAQEEAAHENVEGDDSEELWDNNDPCAKVTAQNKLRVSDFESIEKEMDAAECEVDGEEGTCEVVQGCPQCRPHQDVGDGGAVHRKAEHAEDDAYGGGDHLQ